jgi:hypothetical protein
MPERNRDRPVSARLDPALTLPRTSPATLALDGRDGEGGPHGSHADHENLDNDVDHVAGLGQKTLPRTFCSYPRESDSCGRSSESLRESGCQPVAAVRRLRTSQ